MSLAAEKFRYLEPEVEAPSTRILERPRKPVWAYALVGVVGLVLLEVFGGFSYLIATSLLALVLFTGVAITMPSARKELFRFAVDRTDMLMIVIIYGTVVALYRIAFGVVGNNDLLLFAFFGGGMLVGVAGPIAYTVWTRHRSLTSLGLSTVDLPKVALIALVFAAAQFAVTFWGYNKFPGTRSVVTLLAMALVVGIFETIFFRGFVQGRLEASFGTAPAVFLAALLYGLYHLGYGMGLNEMGFLFGLGVVYALAYATVNNFFIMWPLLTPLGSFFAQLEDGELVGRLPWAALLGIGDVIALMVTVLWLARKRQRRVLPKMNAT